MGIVISRPILGEHWEVPDTQTLFGSGFAPKSLKIWIIPRARLGDSVSPNHIDERKQHVGKSYRSYSTFALQEHQNCSYHWTDENFGKKMW